MGDFKRRDSSKSRGRGPRKFDRNDSGRSRRRDSERFGQRDSGKFRRGSDRPERTKVTCDSCKKRCEVPFKPTSDKPVYCDDCFKKDSGSKSSGSGKELSEISRKLDRIIELLES